MIDKRELVMPAFPEDKVHARIVSLSLADAIFICESAKFRGRLDIDLFLTRENVGAPAMDKQE